MTPSFAKLCFRWFARFPFVSSSSR